MDLGGQRISDTCLRYEPLALETRNSGSHDTVGPVLPGMSQTTRRATCPTPQIANEHDNQLSAFSPKCRKPLPGVFYQCSTCHRGVKTSSSTSTTNPSNPAPHLPQASEGFPPANAASQDTATVTVSDFSPRQISGDTTLPIDSTQNSISQHSSTDTFTLTSQSTSPPTSSTEHAYYICATIRAVYDICLQSTKTYLDSHLANRRARASHSPSFLSHLSHHHPQLKADPGNDDHNCTMNPTQQTAIAATASLHTGCNRTDDTPPIPSSTNSLLKNVSAICSMLWTGSQHSRLDVLNIERMAVDNMSRLLCWAETVALGDYDEWRMAGDDAMWQVLEAGRNLCAWLGVPDGIQGMEALGASVLRSRHGIL